MVKRKNLIDSDSGESGESGSDLDSELLSLAKKQKTKHDEATIGTSNKKPENTFTESDTSDSGDEWDARGSSKKKKKPKPAKRTGKRTITKSSSGSDNDSDKGKSSEPEEGEVTDSEGSESYSSALSQEEFNDGYDENLMGDEEDQACLAQMTEKEREQEIFKRIEQREVMKTRFEIEKKLRLARKQEMRKKRDQEKKKEEKMDAKERSKERKKTVEENRGKVDKKAAAMNLLKARREEKREREEKEKQQRIEQEKRREEEKEGVDREEDDGEQPEEKSNSSKTKLKASDIYSDDSGSESDKSDKPESRKRSSSSSSRSSSDSESDKKSVASSRKKSKRVQYVTKKEDLNKMRLSRYKMERFVHLPFFDRVVKGCFVRVGIGSHNGRPVYRVCEVGDVCETGKIYQLGNTRTNKGLRLRHGAQEKVFRLEYVSNQDFTDNEFMQWRETCALQGISMPTHDELDQKLKDIKEAMIYEFKEEDIEQIVREKQRFKQNPYNYAMTKTQLLKERDMAQSRGDDTEASRIQEKLQALEERAEELDKKRTSTISSISYINDRNRKKNVEGAEKAIKEEVRRNKGKKVDDPFTRRSTKPRMVFRVHDQESIDDMHMITAAEEEDNRTRLAIEAAMTVTPDVEPEKEPEKKKEVPRGGSKTDDLFSAHDFDIKIDLEVPLPNKYKERSILWDPKHEHHYNKIKKEDAWIELAEEMSVEVEECKRKITSLLASLRREKGRIKKSTGTGKGAEEVYESTWFAFKPLLFLLDRNKPGPTEDTIQCNDNSGNKQLPEQNSGTTTDSSCQQNTKKRKSIISPEEVMVSTLDILKKRSEQNQYVDECDAFGAFIAKKLKSYSQRTRAYVQHNMSNVLFSADRGEYEYPLSSVHNINSQTASTSEPPSPQVSEYSHQKMDKVTAESDSVSGIPPVFLSSEREVHGMNDEGPVSFDVLQNGAKCTVESIKVEPCLDDEIHSLSSFCEDREEHPMPVFIPLMKYKMKEESDDDATFKDRVNKGINIGINEIKPDSLLPRCQN